MPKSGKEILKLYLKNGYELIKKQREGSHVKVLSRNISEKKREMFFL